MLYQRALHYIPGSYKLWFNFLVESKRYFKEHKHQMLLEGYLEEIQAVIRDIFEKALIYMNKMPKIWLDYAKFVGKTCGKVSLTR